MVKARSLIVLCLLAAVSLFTASAWADVNFVGVVNPLEKLIKDAEAKGDWKNVEVYTTRLISYLRANGGHKYDAQIVGWYEKRAQAEAKQGKYNEAANTVRESHAWKADAGNIDKVMKFEKNDMDQRDYYNKTLEFYNKRMTLKQEILSMAQEKEKLVKALLKQKDVKKEELEKLRADLKAINEKIAAKREEVKKVHEQYQKDVEGYRKDGIVFNTNQSTLLQEKARKLQTVNDQIQQAQNNAQKGLLEIVEKYKVGWDGLEERLVKMQDVQNKIMDLHKKMLALLDKKPFGDAERKELEALKAELEKLMLEHDKLMTEIENAFMDAKVFNKLTIDQQKKYMEIFDAIRKTQTVIAETAKLIEKKMKEVLFVFGDLNGDGKVDKADLDKMWRDYLVTPIFKSWPPIWRPVPYNKAADVDGDGRITWADYQLVKEVVNGTRKTFPVDPNNLPGDMDGDGALDSDDINMLARVMLNPGNYVRTAFLKIADLNGDGKVNYEDLVALVKKMGEKKDEPVAPVDGSASSAPAATDAATGTGEASGQTDATDGSSGAAADNIGSAY